MTWGLFHVVFDEACWLGEGACYHGDEDDATSWHSVGNGCYGNHRIGPVAMEILWMM